MTIPRPPGQQCAQALAQPYSGGHGRSPHHHPPAWLRTTGPLAGQAGHSPSQCMLPATETEEACSACQEGSGFNPQFQEALSAAPPTSHSPGILGPWGRGLAGVHGVFLVAGLPPPGTVDSPGPTFSSGQGQISAWQPGGLSWALGASCPAALPSSIERRGLLPGPSQWSDHSGPLPAPPHPPPGWSLASTASHLQGGLCFSHAGTLLLPACLWETWTPLPTQPLPGPGAAEASPPHLCHQPLA